MKFKTKNTILLGYHIFVFCFWIFCLTENSSWQHPLSMIRTRNSCVTRSDDLPYYSCVAKSFEEESTECKCFYKSLWLVRKWIEDGWQDNLRDCLGGLDPTVPQDWDPRDPERRLTKLFPKVMHRPSWRQVWSLMYHLSQLLFHWNQAMFHVSYGSI